jgi:ubiquinone/menaquinone biosynthesis C-methylase UbiE
MKRIPTPELLDTDAGTPAEIAASLSDLTRINRWFGGTGTTERLVERVAQACGAPGVSARRTGETPVPPSSSLSLLDVAAGSGYVPRVAKERLSRRGIRLDVTLLDRAATHVGNGRRSVVGDALTLPFRDSSFDVVSSVLFVHHLSPDELVRFVTESLRVCRKAVVINDLIRDPIHLALVYSGLPLYRSRLTRNDAPASVRQAYTQDEMRDILRQTNAAHVEIDAYYLYRMGVIAWKR